MHGSTGPFYAFVVIASDAQEIAITAVHIFAVEEGCRRLALAFIG